MFRNMTTGRLISAGAGLAACSILALAALLTLSLGFPGDEKPVSEVAQVQPADDAVLTTMIEVAKHERDVIQGEKSTLDVDSLPGEVTFISYDGPRDVRFEVAERLEAREVEAITVEPASGNRFRLESEPEWTTPIEKQPKRMNRIISEGVVEGLGYAAFGPPHGFEDYDRLERASIEIARESDNEVEAFVKSFCFGYGYGVAQKLAAD